MRPATASSALKVQAALGPRFSVVEFAETTRSAAEAAAAIGCEVAAIAKSLVFRGRHTGKGVMVVASGANRVDEKKAAALVGEKLERASPEFVREATGYAIGGVPPVGHAGALTILLDPALGRFERIWAAAGTPNAVFALTFDDLKELTGGRVADVCV